MATYRRAPAKPLRQALLDNAPWRPVEPEIADVAALKALQRGEATPEQQRLALDWFINKACRLYDEPYRPGGEDSRRDTDFALGRAFPGRQMVKMLNLNIKNLKAREEK